MKNIEIRMLVSENNMTFKEIAEAMGVSRVYLSRIMGKELTVNNRLRICSAIARIKDERRRKNNE